MSRARLLHGDALAVLKTLPAESVRCAVTSPPYWGLRDYGTARWEGGEASCDHKQNHGVQGATGQRADRTFTAQAVYREKCGRCGAVRTDAQLGLERTPEEYVARLIEVFREVRRVLTNDGTLWLNLGDSHASIGHKKSHSGFGTTGLAGGIAQEHSPRHRENNGPGLKHKDLVGIPWSVAFALRQPYYTGTIRNEKDRIWLAAMLDAEGCLFIHKRKAGQHNGQGYYRQNDNYGPGVEISNTSRAVVERVLDLVGKGSVCQQASGAFGRKQTLYRWNLRTIESREFVREVYPYLVAKQHQARILCGCPTNGTEAEAAHVALKLLHNGAETTVDFKPPAPMFEPGFYLRSDVIWSKCNPMPESVTDRPTRAHEYVFLLSKNARYYYDADALSEPSVIGAGALRNIGTRDKGQSGSRNDGDRFNVVNDGTRNARSVWEIATQPFVGAHFATFPEELAQRCILAGTSGAGGCPHCGAPWVRQVEKNRSFESGSGRSGNPITGKNGPGLQGGGETGDIRRGPVLRRETIRWQPSCGCGDSPIPDTVLDPFCGSGTTCAVAVGNGRSAIGIDLNPQYLDLARQRIGPLLCDEAVTA